jgi:hypothetical protein
MSKAQIVGSVTATVDRATLARLNGDMSDVLRSRIMCALTHRSYFKAVPESLILPIASFYARYLLISQCNDINRYDVLRFMYTHCPVAYAATEDYITFKAFINATGWDDVENYEEEPDFTRSNLTLE